MNRNFGFCLLNLFILIFIIIFKILVGIIGFDYAYLINILFWVLIAIFLYAKGGYPKDRGYYKNTSVKIVLITILIFVLIAYLLGLFLGFVKNLYFNDFALLIKKVLPIILFIILSELSRYLFFKHKVNKIQMFVFTFELIILNIIIGINGYNLSVGKQIFLAITTVVLPAIASEIMYSYVTYNVGMIPTIIYRLFFGLYIYFVPFTPNFSDYLNAVFGIFLPYIIYREIRKNLKYHERYREYAKKILKTCLSVITLLFLVTIILLVSGIFKFQLMAIATGSMEPVYYRGDGVIIEKIDSQDIELGDILVYKTNAGVITHRVVRIDNISGDVIFYTKGDNNETVDSAGVNEDNVIGVVRYIVKYIGYPTILLNDMLESK